MTQTRTCVWCWSLILTIMLAVNHVFLVEWTILATDVEKTNKELMRKLDNLVDTAAKREGSAFPSADELRDLADLDPTRGFVRSLRDLEEPEELLQLASGGAFFPQQEKEYDQLPHFFEVHRENGTVVNGSRTAHHQHQINLIMEKPSFLKYIEQHAEKGLLTVEEPDRGKQDVFDDLFGISVLRRLFSVVEETALLCPIQQGNRWTAPISSYQHLNESEQEATCLAVCHVVPWQNTLHELRAQLFDGHSLSHIQKKLDTVPQYGGMAQLSKFIVAHLNTLMQHHTAEEAEGQEDTFNIGHKAPEREWWASWWEAASTGKESEPATTEKQEVPSERPFVSRSSSYLPNESTMLYFREGLRVRDLATEDGFGAMAPYILHELMSEKHARLQKVHATIERFQPAFWRKSQLEETKLRQYHEMMARDIERRKSYEHARKVVVSYFLHTSSEDSAVKHALRGWLLDGRWSKYATFRRAMEEARLYANKQSAAEEEEDVFHDKTTTNPLLFSNRTKIFSVRRLSLVLSGVHSLLMKKSLGDLLSIASSFTLAMIGFDDLFSTFWMAAAVRRASEGVVNPHHFAQDYLSSVREAPKRHFTGWLGRANKRLQLILTQDAHSRVEATRKALRKRDADDPVLITFTFPQSQCTQHYSYQHDQASVLMSAACHKLFLAVQAMATRMPSLCSNGGGGPVAMSDRGLAMCPRMWFFVAEETTSRRAKRHVPKIHVNHGRYFMGTVAMTELEDKAITNRSSLSADPVWRQQLIDGSIVKVLNRLELLLIARGVIEARVNLTRSIQDFYNHTAHRFVVPVEEEDDDAFPSRAPLTMPWDDDMEGVCTVALMATVGMLVVVGFTVVVDLCCCPILCCVHCIWGEGGGGNGGGGGGVRRIVEVNHVGVQSETSARTNNGTKEQHFLKAPCSTTTTPVPAPFICPITKTIMKDPVVTSDGYTYERKAIVLWMEEHGQRAAAESLPPNLALKSQIKEYLAQRR